MTLSSRHRIRALSVWGRARYLSVTEAPHNTDFYTWMGKKHYCFFQTAETGNRTLAWKAAVLATTTTPALWDSHTSAMRTKREWKRHSLGPSILFNGIGLHIVATWKTVCVKLYENWLRIAWEIGENHLPRLMWIRLYQIEYGHVSSCFQLLCGILFVFCNDLHPANTKHMYSICTTSAQRLRRWPNIVQMLYTCFVFMGRPVNPLSAAHDYSRFYYVLLLD